MNTLPCTIRAGSWAADGQGCGQSFDVRGKGSWSGWGRVSLPQSRCSLSAPGFWQASRVFRVWATFPEETISAKRGGCRRTAVSWWGAAIRVPPVPTLRRFAGRPPLAWSAWVIFPATPRVPPRPLPRTARSSWARAAVRPSDGRRRPGLWDWATCPAVRSGAMPAVSPRTDPWWSEAASPPNRPPTGRTRPTDGPRPGEWSGLAIWPAVTSIARPWGSRRTAKWSHRRQRPQVHPI